MSEIRNKVRGDMAVMITILIDNKFKDAPKTVPTPDVFKLVDQVLTIPELAIVERESDTPENAYRIQENLDCYVAYAEAQQDMLKAGWVREVAL